MPVFIQMLLGPRPVGPYRLALTALVLPLRPMLPPLPRLDALCVPPTPPDITSLFLMISIYSLHATLAIISQLVIVLLRILSRLAGPVQPERTLRCMRPALVLVAPLVQHRGLGRQIVIFLHQLPLG